LILIMQRADWRRIALVQVGIRLKKQARIGEKMRDNPVSIAWCMGRDEQSGMQRRRQGMGKAVKSIGAAAILLFSAGAAAL